MLTDLEDIVLYLKDRWPPLPNSKPILKSVNQDTLAVGEALQSPREENVKSK